MKSSVRVDADVGVNIDVDVDAVAGLDGWVVEQEALHRHPSARWRR